MEKSHKEKLSVMNAPPKAAEIDKRQIEEMMEELE